MRAIIRPRDEALSAINEFEQKARVLLGSDREFLERLRSNKWADHVNRIWSTIQKHQQTSNDDQVIIKNAVCALHVATTYWRLPDQLDEQRQKCTAAKTALGAVWANGLIDRGLKRFGGLSVKDDGTVTSVHGELPKWLRLTRERTTPASQRAMFMAAMSETFQAVLGKRCHEAVAALTDVAFATDTTVDQVRSAIKRFTRRKI
jgi:hypothetical protein